MGGPNHEWVGPPIRDPWDKQGWPFFRGTNGRTMHRNPLSKGEPIGWGSIKTHCTAMDSVADNRRLNARHVTSNRGIAASAWNREENRGLLVLGLFVSLVFFFWGISLVFLSVCSSFCRGFKGSDGEKNLWFFEVFLGVFGKNKEKEDREWPKDGFWPHQEKSGNNWPKIGEITEKWDFSYFGCFSLFLGDFFLPIGIRGEAKSPFAGHFSPVSGGIGHFLRGGTLTWGNDIRVTPRMTVRWRSAPCAPPRYCHAIVAQILVVP